jgi:hypothetical protein
MKFHVVQISNAANIDVKRMLVVLVVFSVLVVTPGNPWMLPRANVLRANASSLWVLLLFDVVAFW